MRTQKQTGSPLFSGRHRWPAWDDVLAPSLVLIVPFFTFVKFHNYPLFKSEILLILMGLFATGLLCSLTIALGAPIIRVGLMSILLTLFVDVQFDLIPSSWKFFAATLFVGIVAVSWLLRQHLTKIVAVVFSTLLFGLLVLPVRGQPKEYESQIRHNASVSSLPFILHLILDEHIGIEGIPYVGDLSVKLKDSLKEFYTGYGFRLFGKAYSRYYYTHLSLSYLFNNDVESPPLDHFLTSEGENRHLLRRNAYLDAMAEKGYRIHVYQTIYMDFCQTPDLLLAACSTATYETPRAIENSPIALKYKMRIILGMYGRLSYIYDQMLRNLYNNELRRAFLKAGLDLPAWHLTLGRVSTLSAMSGIELLTEDISGTERGDMYFAHILMPHFPYVYDADCRLRESPETWLINLDLGMWPKQNSWTGRMKRYELYLEQVICTQKKLDSLFQKMKEAEIYDDAIIIIHSDHGSRILIGPRPFPINKDKLSDRDYVDAFSTLLAVKAPGYEPGYDLSFLALDELLRPTLPALLKRSSGDSGQPPHVILYQESRPPQRVEHPMVSFGDDGK